MKKINIALVDKNQSLTSDLDVLKSENHELKKLGLSFSTLSNEMHELKNKLISQDLEIAKLNASKYILPHGRCYSSENPVKELAQRQMWISE